MQEIIERTHSINVYESGKFIGFLTPRGGTNRLRIHASLMREDRAAQVAEEIDTDPENIKDQLTAKPVPWGKEGK